jgi:hypothetical protein
MKKQLLFLTVILLFVVSNVCSQTVYITKTGKKYHNEDCRYLRRSSIPISLANAIENGYAPCSVCNPPSIVTAKASSRSKVNTTTPRNQNNYSQSVSVRCSAMTKAGRQCKRMTRSPNGRCWQHGGN